MEKKYDSYTSLKFSNYIMHYNCVLCKDISYTNGMIPLYFCRCGIINEYIIFHTKDLFSCSWVMSSYLFT